MIPQPASRSVVGASTAVGMSISCSHPNTLSGYLHTLSLFPHPMGALHFPHGDIYFSGHESLRLASHQNGPGIHYCGHELSKLASHCHGASTPVGMCPCISFLSLWLGSVIGGYTSMDADSRFLGNLPGGLFSTLAWSP